MLLVLYEVIVIVETIMTDSEKGGDGTPLACAASMGHEEIVSYLLGQDVQVNGKDNVCYRGIWLSNAIIFLMCSDNTTDAGS